MILNESFKLYKIIFILHMVSILILLRDKKYFILVQTINLFIEIYEYSRYY